MILQSKPDEFVERTLMMRSQGIAKDKIMDYWFQAASSAAAGIRTQQNWDTWELSCWEFFNSLQAELPPEGARCVPQAAAVFVIETCPLFGSSAAVPKVWVAERTKPGHWTDKMLEIPGGKVKLGERQYEAALREVREEMGITLDFGQIVSLGRPLHMTTPTYEPYLTHYYYVLQNGIQPNPPESERAQRTPWRLMPLAWLAVRMSEPFGSVMPGTAFMAKKLLGVLCGEPATSANISRQ